MVDIEAFCPDILDGRRDSDAEEVFGNPELEVRKPACIKAETSQLANCPVSILLAPELTPRWLMSLSEEVINGLTSEFGM